MKKIIVRLLIGLIILLVLAVFAVGSFLDGAIKTAFNTVGPKITKVETKVDGISLSLLSGSGKMNGLFIGNPEGFKSPSAIQAGSSSFSIQPSSLLSDKIVIKSVKIEAPELTFESDLKNNNLKKLLSNIQETTGASGKEPSKEPSKEPQPKEPSAKPSKKLEVDEFIITGAKLHISVNAPVIGEKSYTATVPDISLPPLGKGSEGVTAAEVSGIALKALLEKAIPIAEGVVADMLKGGQFMGKDLGTNTTSNIQKGLDLFKKK